MQSTTIMQHKKNNSSCTVCCGPTSCPIIRYCHCSQSRRISHISSATLLSLPNFAYRLHHVILQRGRELTL